MATVRRHVICDDDTRWVDGTTTRHTTTATQRHDGGTTTARRHDSTSTQRWYDDGARRVDGTRRQHAKAAHRRHDDGAPRRHATTTACDDGMMMAPATARNDDGTASACDDGMMTACVDGNCSRRPLARGRAAQLALVDCLEVGGLRWQHHRSHLAQAHGLISSLQPSLVPLVTG